MSKIKRFIYLFLFTSLPVLSTLHVTQAGEIDQVTMLAVTCFTCHGVDGVGAKKIPALNDLDENDISESLYGFKSGDEKSTIMGHHAKAYTDEEIDMLVKYFAALKNK